MAGCPDHKKGGNVFFLLGEMAYPGRRKKTNFRKEANDYPWYEEMGE